MFYKQKDRKKLLMSLCKKKKHVIGIYLKSILEFVFKKAKALVPT